MLAKYKIMMSENTINKNINLNTSLVQKGPGSVAPLVVTDDTIAKDASAEATMNSTTLFVDDDVMVARDESHVMHVDRALTQLSNPQEKVDNLLDFLAKPIVLTSSVFTTTDTFSIFNSTSQPFASLQSTQGLLWRQKLAGFFGIRMDMRFRIVVNANKFQAGRYIMGWTPIGGAGPTTSNLKNINFNYAHNATLVQRTTVPHVELDLSTNTVAELLVPFTSSSSFYPLNTCLTGSDVTPLGYLNIYPYSPLVAPTGSTVAGYTVYVSFENVSLYGAASAQAGKSSKGISGNEVANKNNGPISGVSSAISRGFKEFETIPLLGEFSRDVGWISDRITSVASVFGFSKPIAGDCVPKMLIVNAPSHSTVDGDSDARPLSFLNQPSVVPIAGLAGTDYDEMDFSYIKTRYAWCLTDTWLTTDTSGTLIRSIPVSPSTGSVTVLASGYNTFNYTPVSAIASTFNFWRGSLKFRFKIVKTEYHSGRLEFAYFPTDEASYTAGSAYVNRVIVDIRDHSEIELVIPYLCRTPWLEFSAKTGDLLVRVVDPLVAPSSVSPTIDILVELAGGDDIEFAVPANIDLTPTLFTPQSGLADRNVNAILSTTIGNTTVKGDPLIMSSTTMGDKVTSVRALVKRFVPLERAGTNTLSSLNNPIVNVIPDVILFWNGTRASLAGDHFAADAISFWASMYMFMSGGIRIRDNIDFGLTNASLANMSTSVIASNFIFGGSSNTIISDGNPGVLSRNLHRVLQDVSTNNTVTVEVPQYTKHFTRCVADCIIYQSVSMTNATAYTANSSTSYNRVSIATPAGLTVTPVTNYSFHNIYRAGADDLNFSGFISVPPMMSMAPGGFFNNY